MTAGTRFFILILPFLFFFLLAKGQGRQQAGDSCLKTFYNDYNGNPFNSTLFGMVELNDGNLLLGGTGYLDPPAEIQRFGFMTSINKVGEVITSKKIYYKNAGGILKMRKLKDGGVLTMDNASNGADYGTAICRYDQQMNLLWEKIFQPAGLISLTTDDAGNIFFASLVGQLFVDQRLVFTKLAPDGQIIYRYAVKYNDPFLVYGLYGSMCIYNNLLYMTVECAKDLKYHTIMICINPDDGVIQWSRVMQSSDIGELNAFDQLLVSNNRLYSVGNLRRGNGDTFLLLEMNANGDILKSKTFASPKLAFSIYFSPTADGNFIASGSGYDYNVLPVADLRIFLRLNSSLDIVNSKRHVPPVPCAPISLFLSQDGYLYEAGRNFYVNFKNDIYIRKMEPDGKIGDCPSDTLAFVTRNPSITFTNLPMTRQNEPIGVLALTRTELPALVDFKIQHCASKTSSDSIFLSGPSAICDTSVFTIEVHRNKGRTEKTEWITDPSLIKVIKQTDSTLQLQFKNNGTAVVRATEFTGCSILTDSIILKANLSPDRMDLGSDLNLCPDNSILLHAQPNFASYEWQDGSKDSVYQVDQPGKYFVTAYSFCGMQLSDTVIVHAGAAAAIELGGDRIKCNNDTVKLTAPGGYVTYQWYNTNTDTLYGQTIIAQPSVDETWYLNADNSEGCFGRDSIHIIVHHSDPIDLGKDTSLCQGDSIMLYAGNNYSSYLWSSGLQTPSATIKAAGSYWISAVAFNGCISHDTLTISVISPPQVSLDHNSDICKGSIKTLTALPGYAKYFWNDGSTNSSLTIATPGNYWVRVTDSHGCTASDTTVISMERIPPHDFLPADTSFCRYQDLRLSPNGFFKSYSWSNGEQSSFLDVKSAGTYVLQVTDQYGCKGMDTAIVKIKDCSTGIYFPSAFTPNNDGYNDFYRPTIRGQLVNYDLKIYNRFGQLVFATANYQQGWDGKLSGKFQDSNTFVWMCSLQLIDSVRELKRGTLILIR